MMIKLDEIIVPNKMCQSVPNKEKVSKVRKYFITFMVSIQISGVIKNMFGEYQNLKNGTNLIKM